MKTLIEWILRSFTLLITAYLVPGFKLDSYTTTLVVAVVFGIFNLLLKPVLLLLTLPLNILTLGLFTFVINALLLMLTSALVKGFYIDSFFTALIAAVVITVISSLLSIIFK